MRGLKSQSIDSTNAFAQEDIPSGYPVFIGLPRDFNSNVGQYNVVNGLWKILHVQSEDAHLWYENL